MLLCEAEDQPGIVPDITLDTPTDDVRFDMALDNIMNDRIGSPDDLWKPNDSPQRKFSFSQMFQTTPLMIDNGSMDVFSALTSSQEVKIKQDLTPEPHSSLFHQQAVDVQQLRRQRDSDARVQAVKDFSLQSLKKTTGAKVAGKKKHSEGNSKSKLTASGDLSQTPVLDTHGVLPANHRPARGRGRQNQLAKMSEQQIEAEALARLEKNRQAARDCRLRRKKHTEVLEQKVLQLEKKNKEQEQLIASLQAQLSQTQGNNRM